MVTARDFVQPEMSDEAKAIIMKALEMADKDQQELLKKAAEISGKEPS